MIRRRISNELLGQLVRRLDELKQCVDEGKIPAQRAIDDLKFLIDGKTFRVYNIDCDAEPFVPEGWKKKSHKKDGIFEWTPARVRLYFSEHQRDGKSHRGIDIRKELASEPVLNANVLDFLLAHNELIPEEWKGMKIYFWGTIYVGSGGGLLVRCLYYHSGSWLWHGQWLGLRWDGRSPTACLQVA